MKKYIYTPLAAALTLALSACGGGSSDTETARTPNQTEGSTPSITEEKLQSLSLETFKLQCNSPSTPYETDVVFHNESGASIGNAKTNAEGVFSGEVPKGTKHVSVLGEVININDGASTLIRTILNTEDRTNLGKFYYFHFQENCNCESYSLDTSELSYLNSGYTLLHSDGFPISDSVKICTETDMLYLSIQPDDKSDAKAAEVPLPKDSKIIKLTNEDFKHQGVEVLHQVGPDSSSNYVTGYIEAFNSYVFRQYSEGNEEEPLYIFPSITGHNFYRQSWSDSKKTDDTYVTMKTHSHDRINNDGTFVLNELAMPSANWSDELVNFANSTDLSYDFSAVDERLMRASWQFSYLVDDVQESRFYLRVEGDITGSIPDLSFGDVFPEPTDPVQLERLQLSLWGYAGHNTDSKTAAQFLEEAMQGGHLTKEKFGNYLYINMTAQFD